MAKKLSVRELRQHLSVKSQDELVNEIVALYKQFEAVQESFG